jgi:hypothetical protein
LNVVQLDTRITPSLAPVKPRIIPPEWHMVPVSQLQIPQPFTPPTPPVSQVQRPKPLTPPAPPVSSQHRPSPTPSPSTAQSAAIGTGSGIYDCSLEYANVPSGFHFTGTAMIKGIGAVDVFADVYGVGYQNNGTARGTVILSNSQGSVTLKLTGPVQARLSTLPATFTYESAFATGVFRTFKQVGTLQLIRTPSPNPVINDIRYLELGVFHIEIN